MRFNPKARLDTRRMGDSGRGRRSRGGGGMRGGAGARRPLPRGVRGGGIGGAVVILLVVAVTQFLDGSGTTNESSLDASRMSDTGRYAGCETGADANESADCARVAVENSLFDYWSSTFEEQTGVRFEAQRRLQTFSGAITTGCGEASSDVGPFYCPADSSIYLDTTFFAAVLERQLDGPSGAFVEPYVLAHEYGHHLQNLLGTMGRVRTQQGPRSDSVRLELQADCYAGMWAGSATTTDDATGEPLFESLTDQDIQEAIAAATAVGDDRIQEKTGGRVNPEQWSHGSSTSRVKWFMVGLEQGSTQACDTFATDDL